MAKKSFSFMLDDDVRREAERMAKDDNRTLGTWMAMAAAEKLARDKASPARPSPSAPARARPAR